MLGILSVLIIVHECGHFLVARFFGFQTPVFGFGLPFGPSMTVGKKWGTEFKIHACLLGGYVAIPELGDESNADAFGPPEQPWRKFPIWQRALVAVAGVTFNVIFAYLICLVMVLSMGDPVQVVVAGKCIESNPIAKNAGFTPGDEIISIDGTNVVSHSDTIALIKAHKNTKMDVQIRRPKVSVSPEDQPAVDPHKVTEADYLAQQKTMTPITLTMVPNEKGAIGLELNAKVAYFRKVDGNPFEIAGYAAYKLADLTKSMVEALIQMVQGLFQGLVGGNKASSGTPSVGIQDLHGVLAVVVFGADVAQQDWSQLFLFTIMISMDLAIINLLPWPALDGGHLAFMCYEAIRGKPMEERAQGEIVKWGFISLIVLMVVIMVNDVSALMTGKLSFKAMKDKAKEVREQKKDVAPAGSTEAPATPETVKPTASESATPAAPAAPADAGTDAGTKER